MEGFSFFWTCEELSVGGRRFKSIQCRTSSGAEFDRRGGKATVSSGRTRTSDRSFHPEKGSGVGNIQSARRPSCLPACRSACLTSPQSAIFSPCCCHHMRLLAAPPVLIQAIHSSQKTLFSFFSSSHISTPFIILCRQINGPLRGLPTFFGEPFCTQALRGPSSLLIGAPGTIFSAYANKGGMKFKIATPLRGD